MRGFIYVERVSDSVLDFVHGQSYPVTRVVVPEAGGLILTVCEGKAPVAFILSESTLRERLAEVKSETRTVDVPDELVANAKSFITERDKFEMALRQFWGSEKLPA